MNKFSAVIIFTVLITSLVLLNCKTTQAMIQTDPGFPVIDGQPDYMYKEKASFYRITNEIDNAERGEAKGWLMNSARGIYVYFLVQESAISCDDDKGDFKNSDHFKLYLNIDASYNGRTVLGEKDWVIAFVPLNENGEWIPRLRELAYNGPGHGGLEDSDITTAVKSAEPPLMWSVEAFIPWTYFGVDYNSIKGRNMGVNMIYSDTDTAAEGYRGMKVLSIAGEGDFWQSPDCFVEYLVQ